MDFGIQNNAKPALSLGNIGASAPPAQSANPQINQPPPQSPQQASPPPLNSQRPPATGVSLKKGQKVSLTKMNASLDNILVGLGWDISQTTSVPHDLDVEVFMLGDNDRVVGDDWFVFYNQLNSPDGSVTHSGDNRTGLGEGDDEVVKVKLSQVDSRVKKLVFIVTINEANERGHNFGQLSNAYIRIVDVANGKEMVRFNLTDYYTDVLSMQVGDIYRHNNEWKFNPVGEGLNNDLYGLCARFGVNVES